MLDYDISLRKYTFWFKTWHKGSQSIIKAIQLILWEGETNKNVMGTKLTIRPEVGVLSCVKPN